MKNIFLLLAFFSLFACNSTKEKELELKEKEIIDTISKKDTLSDSIVKNEAERFVSYLSLQNDNLGELSYMYPTINKINDLKIPNGTISIKNISKNSKGHFDVFLDVNQKTILLEYGYNSRPIIVSSKGLSNSYLNGIRNFGLEHNLLNGNEYDVELDSIIRVKDIAKKFELNNLKLYDEFVKNISVSLDTRWNMSEYTNDYVTGFVVVNNKNNAILLRESYELNLNIYDKYQNVIFTYKINTEDVESRSISKIEVNLSLPPNTDMFMIDKKFNLTSKNKVLIDNSMWDN